MNKALSKKKMIAILLPAVIITGCLFNSRVSSEHLRHMVASLLSRPVASSGNLVITEPETNSVFPPEIAAPVFQWHDTSPDAGYWIVVVENRAHAPIWDMTRDRFWEPDRETWETIKMRSVKNPAKVTVFGLDSTGDPEPVSCGTIHISTSEDSLDASVLYRQVPLPFLVGKANFKKVKWRLGNVADYNEPSVVMRNIPVCASCHQVTADGKIISMELNYKNDSGAQFVTRVSQDIVLSDSDFMTWSDFPKSPILPNTRGLFARISPSGRYIVSTVNEVSYAALTNEPGYCQLFFPTYGILATYSVASRAFSPLKGADDRHYIQTNPAWHPSEKEIVFARAETRNDIHESITNIKTQIKNCGIDELNKCFPIRFDLWRVPFNNGLGGAPEPVKGASGNGMSNYFPRFSPDGKWIVFTQSPTGIMLQPESALYIIPSEGGKARRMTCNRGRFNSWHSWSPNSRWLLFSSKTRSIYTEIYITHIDENGNDSPPVRLLRFSDDKLAANLPEFVSPETGKIRAIRLADE